MAGAVGSVRGLAQKAGLTRPAVSIDELRARARNRIPRPVFDFIDGGAEDERTLRSNLSDFERITFRPDALVDVSSRVQRTTVLGTSISSPVILGPAGLARLAHHSGEVAAAQAARDFGTIFTLSTASSQSIEQVAAVGDAPRWFQLYVWTDRGATRSLVDRARAAGYKALCFTIDVPLSGQRERDLRNGMTIPPRPAPRTFFQWAKHPWWVRRALIGDPITFGNFRGQGASNSAVSLGTLVNSQLNPSMCWDDLVWLRQIWDGPLVVKGAMGAATARRAVDIGADAILVSNHGGRQLDGLPSTISILPEVVAAVGDRVEVYLDGGLRRGSDVVKALALGARACLIGRPWMYALAAGGQAGVARALQILSAEVDRTLALVGVTDVANLSAEILRTEALPAVPDPRSADAPAPYAVESA